MYISEIPKMQMLVNIQLPYTLSKKKSKNK